MNQSYFPPAPVSPFSQYGYMQQPPVSREDMAKKIAQGIIGQPTQNVAQGVGQLAAGIGLGLANYKKNGSEFPTAPGGASPSFGTTLANFFTGRHNGGLF